MMLLRTTKSLMTVTLITLFWLLGAVVSVTAQDATPIFRIGVLDEENTPFLHGIELAVKTINEAGGVIGADGTAFGLEIILQSPRDMTTALANMNQARVVAVLGPPQSADVLANLTALQGLNVPILTPAMDDSMIALDTTNRIFRLRAQEVFLGRSLADYLTNDLGLRRIATAQLDLESTGGVFGFINALQSVGVTPIGTFILDGVDNIDVLVSSILGANLDGLAVYGGGLVASSLYVQLRDNGWEGRFIYNGAQDASFRQNIARLDLQGILLGSTWHPSAEDETSVRFLLDYIQVFGQIPNALSAAGYDGVSLLQDAIERPNDLLSNLQALQNIEGVQGLLNPSGLAVGEMSNNTMIIRLNSFGGGDIMARYIDNMRIEVETSPLALVPTSTPAPTATPDGVTLTITRAVQNIRTGPGLDYDIIGQLREGEQAQIIGATADNRWVVINFRGQDGWLSRDILDIFGNLNTVPIIVPPATPTPLPATATPTSSPSIDITIVSASPGRLTLGQPFNVTVVVRNQGSLPAGAFAVAASFQPGDVYTAVNVPSLGANTDVTLNLTGTLGTGATGLQSVTIVGDLNQQLDEGPGGRANNNLLFNYIADAPVMTGGSGLVAVNDGFGTSLDGGAGNDIVWSGGVLSGVGGTLFIPLNGFASINDVHRDAIPTPTTVSLSGAAIQPGSLIGFITDGSGKIGVMQIVTSASGGQLQFNVRVYD